MNDYKVGSPITRRHPCGYCVIGAGGSLPALVISRPLVVAAASLDLQPSEQSAATIRAAPAPAPLAQKGSEFISHFNRSVSLCPRCPPSGVPQSVAVSSCYTQSIGLTAGFMGENARASSGRCSESPSIQNGGKHQLIGKQRRMLANGLRYMSSLYSDDRLLLRREDGVCPRFELHRKRCSQQKLPYSDHFDCPSITSDLAYKCDNFILFKESPLTAIPEENTINISSPSHKHLSYDFDQAQSPRCSKLAQPHQMVPSRVAGYIVELNSQTDTDNELHKITAGHSDGHASDGYLSDDSSVDKTIKFEHVNIYDAYKEHFCGKEHDNIIFIDSLVGCAVMSVKSEANGYALRTILRSSLYSRHAIFDIANCMEVCPAALVVCAARQLDTRLSKFEVEPVTCLSCLNPSKRILDYDEHLESKHFKFGVLLQKKGQLSEEQIFHNTQSSPEFETFMDAIAERVNLKTFDGYKGGLDSSDNEESYYTTFKGKEIMFHVCTMLPLTVGDRQQLQRKRHIGNDIVVLVFQECDDLCFSPDMLQSNFVHCIIVVQAMPATHNTRYKLSVLRREDVPSFGPPIPALIESGEVRDFILNKLIRAEYACYRADRFKALQTRTRDCLLQSLVKQLRPDIELGECRLLGEDQRNRSLSRKSVLTPSTSPYASRRDLVKEQFKLMGHVRKALNRKFTSVLPTSEHTDSPRAKSLPTGFPIQLNRISEEQLVKLEEARGDQHKGLVTRAMSVNRLGSQRHRSVSEVVKQQPRTEEGQGGQGGNPAQSFLRNMAYQISLDSLNDHAIYSSTENSKFHTSSGSVESKSRSSLSGVASKPPDNPENKTKKASTVKCELEGEDYL